MLHPVAPVSTIITRCAVRAQHADEAHFRSVSLPLPSRSASNAALPRNAAAANGTDLGTPVIPNAAEYVLADLGITPMAASAATATTDPTSTVAVPVSVSASMPGRSMANVIDPVRGTVRSGIPASIRPLLLTIGPVRIRGPPMPAYIRSLSIHHHFKEQV